MRNRSFGFSRRVDDRHGRALWSGGHLGAGAELVRKRLDDARAEAGAYALVAVVTQPNAVVGHR